ncbi:hypothetical protein Ahy_B02g060209 isoform A [Arachis hypogaea]|uniref:Zinc finger C3HC4 RING-type domain-containing protein n=1 Tax=Arachis hypogaea TaxID=3818 RepID=A0A445AHZ7_ARAHY|nr:hypothetical protein Ahy_B02g060209 isoform A [Arachis hypogaea]
MFRRRSAPATISYGRFSSGSAFSSGYNLRVRASLSLLNSPASLPCSHVLCSFCIVKSVKSPSDCPVYKLPFFPRVTWHMKKGNVKLMLNVEERMLLAVIKIMLKRDERLNDIVGSAYYVAPEVLHRSDSVKADIWNQRYSKASNRAV